MDIKIPVLAEGIEEVIITLWHVKEGQSVSKDSDVVEVATDKATFNIPSPADGVISNILHTEGDTVKVGEKIAEVI